MPVTYEPIATQTLASAVADVYFNSIPQTYTDLILVVNGSVATATNCGLRFNSDNTTNYSETYVYGDGSSAVSGRLVNRSYLDGGGIQATGKSMVIFQIFNYTNTTTFKSAFARCSETGATYSWALVWRKTPEAINSINVLTANGATYSAGSTFTLYGIKAA